MRNRKRAATPGEKQRVKQSPIILSVSRGYGSGRRFRTAKSSRIRIFLRKRQRPDSNLERKLLKAYAMNYVALRKLALRKLTRRSAGGGTVMKLSDWCDLLAAGILI